MTPHIIRATSGDELESIVWYCRDAYEVTERSADIVVMRRLRRSFPQYVGDFFLSLLGQGIWAGRDRSNYPKAVLDIPPGTEWVAIQVEAGSTDDPNMPA